MSKLLITLTAAVLFGQYVIQALGDIVRTIRAQGNPRSLAAELSRKLDNDRSLLVIAVVANVQPKAVRAIINRLVWESRGAWSYQQAADIVERYAMETGRLPAGLDFTDRDFYEAAVASGHVKEVKPEDVKFVVAAVWLKSGYGYHFSAN